MKSLLVTCVATAVLGSLTGCQIGDDKKNPSEIPAEVSEAYLIGVTPHDDFDSSGLVDFALLPKDGSGASVIHEGLHLSVSVALPAGTTATQQDQRTEVPDANLPLTVALDFDSSGSMADTDPNGLRKVAGKQFIETLAEGAPVAIFDFGAGATGTADFSSTRLLADFTTDKAAAKAAVDSLQPDGGTPMYASVVEVLDFYNRKYAFGSANRSLLVLGDGAPTGAGTLQDACDKATQTGIQLNTVGFGPAADQSPDANPSAVEVMRQLATCGGGAYAGVVNADELQSTYKNFATATTAGRVVLTVQLSPIPLSDETVTGSVSVGNGVQAAPVAVPYQFDVP